MEVSNYGNDSEVSERLDDFLHCPLCSWEFQDAPLLTYHIQTEHKDWTLYKVISKANETHKIAGCEVLEEVDNVDNVHQRSELSNGNNDDNAVALKISNVVTVKQLPEVSLCNDLLTGSDSDNEIEIVEPSSEGYYSWRQKTAPHVYDISDSETENEIGDETGLLTCEGNDEIFVRSFQVTGNITAEKSNSDVIYNKASESDDEIFLKGFQGTGYIKAENDDSDVIYNEASEGYFGIFEESNEKSYLRQSSDRRCKGEKKIANKQNGKKSLGQKHHGGKIIIANVPSCRVWVDQGKSGCENAKSSVELGPTTVDRKVSCLHHNVTLQKCISNELGCSKVIPSPNKLNLLDNTMNINIINVASESTHILNNLVDGGQFPAESVVSNDCSIVAEGLGSYTTLSVIEHSESLNSNDFSFARKMTNESSLCDSSSTAEVAASQYDSESKCQHKLLEDFNEDVRITDSSSVDLEDSVDVNESIYSLSFDNAAVKDVLTQKVYSVQSDCVDSAERARKDDETSVIRRLSIDSDKSEIADFLGFSDCDEQDSLNDSNGCIKSQIKNIIADITKELDETLNTPDSFDASTSDNRVEDNFISNDNMKSDLAGDLNDKSRNIDCMAIAKTNSVNAPNSSDCDMAVNCKKSRTVLDLVRADIEESDKFENHSCESEQISLRDVDCNPIDSGSMNQTTNQVRCEPLVSKEACLKGDRTFAVPYPSRKRLKTSRLSDSISTLVSDNRKRRPVPKVSLVNFKTNTRNVENVASDRFGEKVNLDEHDAVSSRREQYMPCSSQLQEKNVSAKNPAKRDCQVLSGYLLEKLYISSGEGQLKVNSSNICTAKQIVSIENNGNLRAEAPEFISDFSNQSNNSTVNDPEHYENNAKESTCSGSSIKQIDETSDHQNLTEIFGSKTIASPLTPSKAYKCKKCLVDLRDCQSLKSHRCIVPSLKPFKCSICLFSFSRKRRLALHVQKCSRKRERQTSVVRKSNHTKTLDNKMECECFICFKRVNSKFRLVRHLFRFHADVVKQDTVKSKILSNLDITEDFDSKVTTNYNRKNDIDSFEVPGNVDHLDLTDTYPEDSYFIHNQVAEIDHTKRVQEIIERGNVFSSENPFNVESAPKNNCENPEFKISEDFLADVGPPSNNSVSNHSECHERKSTESLSDPVNCQANKNTFKEEGTCRDRQKSKEIISPITKCLPKDILLDIEENSSVPPSCQRSSTKLLVCIYCGEKFVGNNGFRSHLLECANNRSSHKSNICCTRELAESGNSLNYNEEVQHTQVENQSVPFELERSISTRLFYNGNEDQNEKKSCDSPCSSVFCAEQSFQDSTVTQHKLYLYNTRNNAGLDEEPTTKPHIGEKTTNEIQESPTEMDLCSTFEKIDAHQDSTVMQHLTDSSEFAMDYDASAREELAKNETSVCLYDIRNNVGLDEEPTTKPHIEEKTTNEIQKSPTEMDLSNTFEKIDAHQSVHNSSNIHVCIYCKKSYASKYTLRYHQRKFHNFKGSRENRKLFKCTNCVRTYRSKYALKYHYEGCSGARNPSICELCGRGLSNKYNLVYHYRRCLGNVIRKLDIPDGASSQCSYCDRKYANKYTLAYHIIKHKCQPPKSKMVTSESDEFMEGNKSEIIALEQHTEVANDRQGVLETEKLYKCVICDRNFRSYYSLYSHKRNMHSDTIKASRSIPIKQQECTEVSNFGVSTLTMDDAVTSAKSFSNDPDSKEENEVTRLQNGYSDFLSHHSIFKVIQDSSPAELILLEEIQQTAVNCEKTSNNQIKVMKVNDFLGFTASLVCKYCGIAFTDALYYKLHLTKHRNKGLVCGHRKTFELKLMVEKLDIDTSERMPGHVNLKQTSFTRDLVAVKAVTDDNSSEIVKLKTADIDEHDIFGGYFRTCNTQKNCIKRSGSLPHEQNNKGNSCFLNMTSAGRKLNRLSQMLGHSERMNCKSKSKFKLDCQIHIGAQGKYSKRSLHGNVCEHKAKAIEEKDLHSNESAAFSNSKDVPRTKKWRKVLKSRLEVTSAKAEEKAWYYSRKSGKIYKRNASVCRNKVAHLCRPRYYCLKCSKSFKYTPCLNRHFVYFHPETKPLEGISFSIGKP